MLKLTYNNIDQPKWNIELDDEEPTLICGPISSSIGELFYELKKLVRVIPGAEEEQESPSGETPIITLENSSGDKNIGYFCGTHKIEFLQSALVSAGGPLSTCIYFDGEPSDPVKTDRELNECLKFILPGGYSGIYNDAQMRITGMVESLLELPKGGLVALDDFSQGLDPVTALRLLTTIKRLAEKRSLHVLLGTQCGLVLKHYDPGMIYYVDPKEGAAKITEMESEEWLAQSSLDRNYIKLLYRSLDEKETQDEF